MSKYTTELRFICENYSGLLESTGYNGIEDVIESARSKVFDFAYPIFDEAYRSVLETKILKHYYTREIGAESVGLWKHWLNTKLNEIMPYYNKMYKSELLEFNPMYDVDIKKTYKLQKDGTKTDTGLTTGNVTSTDKVVYNNSNMNYYADTPQGAVSDLENLDYLTNATKDVGNGESTNTGNNTTNTNSSLASVIKNTDDYLESVSGKTSGSSYAKLLEDYRATFLNIDMMIIDELKDLFMNLW